MADDLEARTISRVAWRFIPFLILCNFVAFVDRVNVGFAKLTMNADLKLSDTQYGFAQGCSFSPTFCSRCLRTSSCALVITLALGHDERLERAPEAAE
jgi:hypothetical protein